MKKVMLSFALLAAFACASNDYEITGVVGGVKPFKDYDFDNHMTYGIRFGIPAQTFLTSQIELGYDYSSDVDLNQAPVSSSMHRMYLNAVKEFMTDSNTRPYALLGIGYRYAQDEAISDDLEGSFGQYGVGIKHFLTENVGVKGEIRHAIKFSGDHESSLFYTLGLFAAFGGEEEPVVVTPPPPAPAPVVATPPASTVVAPIPAPVEEVVIQKVVMTNQNFNFAFDSAKINDSGMSLLKEIADNLATAGNIDVSVIANGHTDSVGTDKYNQALSERRANAVKDVLVGLGVASDRITAKGFGESEPVATNDTEEGRAENRRVEVIFEDVK